MFTKLDQHEEPVKLLLKVFTVVMIVVGGGLTALSQVYDWPWLTAPTALISIIVSTLTARAARNVVTPQPHVDELLDGLLEQMQAAKNEAPPAEVDVPAVPTEPAPSAAPDGSALDEALKASGLG